MRISDWSSDVCSSDLDRVQEMSKRRKSGQDSLKDLEKKQEEKSRKIGDGSLKMRLGQTGLRLTPGRFYMLSAVPGVIVLLLTLMAGVPLLGALGAGFAAAVGLPRWIVGFLIKRSDKSRVGEECVSTCSIMWWA